MQKIMIIVALILSGCASVAPPRAEYTNIPPLESGWSRVYIGGGYLLSTFKQDLKYANQTGPVWISDQKVGSTGYKEYIAVDLLPGSYEAYWTQEEKTEKYCPEKTSITLKAGEVHYFSGDIALSAGNYFGLIGVLASNCLWNGKLTEMPLDDKSKSKLVSYFKFNGSSNSNLPKSIPDLTKPASD